MGIMTNHACRGGLILVLTVLVVLGAVFQGFAEGQGMKRLRKAAEQGHVEAQLHLGFMYAGGEGVPEDDREAVKWFGRAAEQGHAGAQAVLILIGAKGKGVSEDSVKAYAWVALAAAQGNDKAVNSRDWLRRQMTAEQVAEAQKLAAALRERIESPESH